jgi:hypothetical protein
MRVCPVCNEAFTDEFSFCDLDGTALKRQREPGDTNRLWSLLGVGLLVGALVISAASIIFLPKARVAPPTIGSRPASNEQSEPAAIKNTDPFVVSEESESPKPSPLPTAAQRAAMSEAEIKDMASDTRTNADPKAAALAAEEKSDVKDVPKLPSEPPKEKIEEPKRPVTAAAEPTPKERKADQARNSTKETAKETAAQKSAKDKDKEKKGGFLGIFKKIFGKKQ